MSYIKKGGFLSKDDIKNIVRKELPFLNAFYENSSELENDFNDYLSYYLSDSLSQEMVEVSESVADSLATKFQDHFLWTAYNVIDFIKNSSFEEIFKIYKTNQLTESEFSILLDNAKFELNNGNFSLQKSMLCSGGR